LEAQREGSSWVRPTSPKRDVGTLVGETFPRRLKPLSGLAWDGRVETLPFRKKSPAAIGLRRVALREFSHLSFAKVGDPVWWLASRRWGTRVWWLKDGFFLGEAHVSEARREAPGWWLSQEGVAAWSHPCALRMNGAPVWVALLGRFVLPGAAGP